MMYRQITFAERYTLGVLRRGALSHETIYRYVWADKRAGGTLYQHLRGARKPRRELWPLRQPWPLGRQTPDHRAAADRRDAPGARALGSGYDAGREPGWAVRAE